MQSVVQPLCARSTPVPNPMASLGDVSNEPVWAVRAWSGVNVGPHVPAVRRVAGAADAARRQAGGDGRGPAGRPDGVPYAELLESWYGSGYAGAMGWAVNGGSSAALSWSMGKTAVKTLADAKGCTTTY